MTSALKPLKEIPGIYKNTDEAWEKHHERLDKFNRLYWKAWSKRMEGTLSPCDFAAVEEVLRNEIRKTEETIRILAVQTGKKLTKHVYNVPK